jgi:hypothetical protein
VRPGIIGRTEEEATFRLVVVCHPDLKDAVDDFFGQPLIAALLSPLSSTGTPLDFYILAEAPKLRSAREEIAVHCRSDLAGIRDTYCGAPIVLQSKAAPGGCRITRQATFGGIIKVNYGHNDFQFYGITGGHAVEGLTDFGMPCSEARQASMDDLPLHGKHDWICQHNVLGELLDSENLPGVTAGRAKQSNDWALFSIKARRPNEARRVQQKADLLPTDDNSHPILKATHPCFNDGASDPVIVLGSTPEDRRGELSALQAQIWVAQSGGFVDAYLLELETGESKKTAFRHISCANLITTTVRDGDSGAWVVHNSAPELYGHIIATDAFGSVYIMPAPDTLDNIRECTGAISVTLPEVDDCRATSSPCTAETVSDEVKHTRKSTEESSWTSFLKKRWDPTLLSQIPFPFEYASHRYASSLSPQVDGYGDNVIRQLMSYDDTLASSAMVEAVVEFCRQTSLNEFHSCADAIAGRQASWLDDSAQVRDPGHLVLRRHYEGLLSANDLRQHLRQKVITRTPVNVHTSSRRLC